MVSQPEPVRKSPKKLPGLWRVIWTLLWLLLSFFMLVWVLCGLVFVVVGLMSFWFDFGEGAGAPRLGGELTETIVQKIAFTAVGAAMVITGAGYFWLTSRGKQRASVVAFVVIFGVFMLGGWLTGIHSISCGFADVGSVAGNR